MPSKSPRLDAPRVEIASRYHRGAASPGASGNRCTWLWYVPAPTDAEQVPIVFPDGLEDACMPCPTGKKSVE